MWLHKCHFTMCFYQLGYALHAHAFARYKGCLRHNLCIHVCMSLRLLKTYRFSPLLKVHLVPQGSPDKKTHAFWTVTVKNSYQMTTFQKNIIQNHYFFMKSLVLIILSVHLVPQGSPDEKTHTFWKVNVKNSFKMMIYKKNHYTKYILFDEKS